MKSIVPSPEDEHLARVLHALSNPVRLAIMRYVEHHPGCICNDLVLRFGRAQATISQHLALLRNVHLLEAEQDGNAICYFVDHAALQWASERLVALQHEDS
jgi:DNA-binding transcriptional ArsR family regulator